MTSGPKAGSRGKGRGEEVKTEKEHNPINPLPNTPQVVWATEHLENKRADENEKQGGCQIIVRKMLV